MTQDQHATPAESAAMSRVERTYDDVTPASIAIVHAIAMLEGVEPTDLGLTLHDHVPPDILNQLLTHENAAGGIEIAFTTENYHVQIRDTGKVIVSDPGEWSN